MGILLSGNRMPLPLFIFGLFLIFFFNDNLKKIIPVSLISLFIILNILRFFQFIIIIATLANGGFYEVGNTVSTEHQNTPYPICYGDYPSDNLQLSHFNGYEYGGEFTIIWIEMLATW